MINVWKSTRPFLQSAICMAALALAQIEATCQRSCLLHKPVQSDSSLAFSASPEQPVNLMGVTKRLIDGTSDRPSAVFTFLSRLRIHDLDRSLFTMLQLPEGHPRTACGINPPASPRAPPA